MPANSQWASHTVKAGPRKGRTVYRNTRTGELRDQMPAGRSTGPDREKTGKRPQSDRLSTGPATAAHPRVARLLALAKSVPGAIKEKVASFVAGKYRKLADRYGDTGAKLILAGVVLTLPVPLPGTSLVPVALAEGVVRLRRLLRGNKAAGAVTAYAADAGTGFDPAELSEAAAEFLHALYAEMREPAPDFDPVAFRSAVGTLERKKAGSGQVATYHAASPPRPGLVWDERSHHWIRPEEAKSPRRKKEEEPAAPEKGHPPERVSSDAPTGRATTTATGRPARKTAPKVRPKSLSAAAGYVDLGIRRRVIRAVRNEGELSEAISGFNFPDSEPADVIHAVDAAGKPVTTREGIRHLLSRREMAVRELKRPDLTDEHRDALVGILTTPVHFFEVKTLLTSKSGKAKMSGAAVKRKERWARRYAVEFHAVLVDDRRGAKSSGHRVYVRPYMLGEGGTGNTLDPAKMVKAADLAGVMKHVTGGGK